MQPPPPRSLYLREDLDALTVLLPARADVLTADLLRRLGLAALLMLGLMMPLLSLFIAPVHPDLQGVLNLLLLLIVGGGVWGLWRSWEDIRSRFRLALRITPQRVMLQRHTLLLEEVTGVVLDLDRGRLRLEVLEGPPLVLPVELDYAEMVWLRTLLEGAVARRRGALGSTQPSPRQVPTLLAQLRQR